MVINVIADPSFRDPAQWNLGAASIGTIGLTDNTSLTRGGGMFNVTVRFINGATTYPAAPGEVWRIAGAVKTTPDYNGTAANSKIRLATQSGALLTSATFANGSAGADWTWVQATVTIPADVTGLTLIVMSDHTVGQIWWDDIRLERLSSPGGGPDPMAVRASDRMTLATLPTPTYVRLYYCLQASTLAAPALPTANPPTAPWTGTEPTYTEGSTSTLYTSMLSVWGDGSFTWGDVQISSSFEAAKTAYNRAVAAALQAATADGRITISGAAPITANGSGKPVGAVWIVRPSGTITAIWEWSGTAWANRGLDVTIIPQIAIGTGTFGELDGVRLTTKSVSTGKLLVGDFTNLLEDPAFKTTVGWTASLPAALTYPPVTDHPVTGTGTVVQVTANGSIIDVSNNLRMDVQPDDSFYGEVYARKLDPNMVGEIQYATTINRTTGGDIWPSFQVVNVTSWTVGQWYLLSGVVTVPANATAMRARLSVRQTVLSGRIQFAAPTLRRRNNGKLIVDGAILAAHIQADTALFDKIFSNTLITGRVKVDALEPNIGDKLNLSGNGALLQIGGQLAQATSDLAVTNAAVSTAQATASQAQATGQTAQGYAVTAINQISATDELARATAAALTAHKSIFQITSDGARLVTPDGSSALLLTPAGASIQQNGVAQTTWTAGQMVVPNAVVDQASIGTVRFEKSGSRTLVRQLT